MASYGIQEPTDLASVIAGMSYAGLMRVAAELVKMNAEGERDVKMPNGMAETLSDWADYMITETRIEANAARAAAEAAKKAA